MGIAKWLCPLSMSGKAVYSDSAILTLPISRYFEPDDEGDLATVHTSIVSAHETLVEIDALYIRLTDISRGILDGHI